MSELSLFCACLAWVADHGRSVADAKLEENKEIIVTNSEFDKFFAIAQQINKALVSVAESQGNIRKMNIQIGKWLRSMKKVVHKVDGYTWELTCSSKDHAGLIPLSRTTANRYIKIADFPKAYKAEMSVEQAAREAQKWIDNGGQEPANTSSYDPMANSLVQKIQLPLQRYLRQIDGILDREQPLSEYIDEHPEEFGELELMELETSIRELKTRLRTMELQLKKAREHTA